METSKRKRWWPCLFCHYYYYFLYQPQRFFWFCFSFCNLKTLKKVVMCCTWYNCLIGFVCVCMEILIVFLKLGNLFVFCLEGWLAFMTFSSNSSLRKSGHCFGTDTFFFFVVLQEFLGFSMWEGKSKFFLVQFHFFFFLFSYIYFWFCSYWKFFVFVFSSIFFF